MIEEVHEYGSAHFNGCVPHGIDNATATEFGRQILNAAIKSLRSALIATESPLHLDTLRLIGIDGIDGGTIDRWRLVDVTDAMLDLLNGRIVCDAQTTDVMPGSIPYNHG